MTQVTTTPVPTRSAAQTPRVPAHGGHHAAVVGPRRPCQPALPRGNQRPGRRQARVPPDQIRSSCSHARPAGRRPRGHPSGAGEIATRGSSTTASSAAPSPSSRRPGRAGLRATRAPSSPQPFDPAAGAPRWPTPTPSDPATSSPVLRDRLRHRRGDPDQARGGPSRAPDRRPHGPGRRAEAWVSQPQLGVFASRQPLADRLRRPHRHHRPDLVHLEMDMFWAPGAPRPSRPHEQHRAGLQYHVKDLNQDGSFADPGDG